MKFSVLTAALASVASAIPISQVAQRADDDVQAFGIMALRSASPIHFGQFGAAARSVFINLPAQNATCDGEAPTGAIFYLKDGGLYLYGNTLTQQLYADRSGMGQGKFGYITGDEGKPRNGELTTWAIDENDNLSLNGAGWLACPNSIDGAWSVWVNAGTDKPGFNEGCLGFSARTVPLDDNFAVKCDYTQER
ncbi:unnamed protein product [Clonostachys byssicola]|uniref:Cell wall protein PhiA n=1 Tax=Clonostachys byssicola TaxID=160290 RepID=A0A9N9UMY9_9HYPO|nr:unnamed protein product [Clonostachys byssicola]